MEGSLDLYVLNMSGWKLHTFFDASDEETAVQAAIDTKDARGYAAVCLVNDDLGRMVYCFNSLGEKFTYSGFQRSLRENFKPPRSAKQKAQDAGKKAANSLLDEPEEEENDDKKSGPSFDIQLPKLKKGTQILLSSGVGVNVFVLITLIMLGVDAVAIAALMSACALASLWAIMFDPLKVNADEKTKKLIEAEKARRARVKYCKDILDRTLAEGKKHRWSYSEKKMVGDSHFALMLFLGGACESLSKGSQNIELVDLHHHVAKALQNIGILETVAMQSFSQIHEYLLYPRYARMYTFGSEGAKRLLTTSGTNIGVEKALDDWEVQKEQAAIEQQQAAEDASCSAVMFTDIVSFTQQVAEKGNDWMVDVLRAHNEVVRTVLTSFGGREVKHTGDGIMASFKTVEDAVRGAIAMQQGFAVFVEQVPHRHFEVRCGISAGEPVHMDGDLFGTPVNMAARVMPFAGGGEIAISQETYDVLHHIPFNYKEIPDVTLKGFEGLHSVWLLMWKNVDLNDLPTQKSQPDEQRPLRQQQAPQSNQDRTSQKSTLQVSA